MGIEHDTLSVLSVGAELKGTTIQANRLADLTNPFLVEVGEQVQLEDTLSDLRR